MKKQYKLIGYIDREDVNYGFLIPVFKSDNKSYFHQLSEDSKQIISFRAFNEKDYEDDSFKEIASTGLEKRVLQEPTFIFKHFGQIIIGSVSNDHFKNEMLNCIRNPQMKNTFLRKEIYKLFDGDGDFENIKNSKSGASKAKVEISVEKASRNVFERRREPVTRVYLSKGEGKITVNDKDYKTYFPLVYLQNQIERPLKTVDVLNKFDVKISTAGGGVKTQAESAMFGIARVLLQIDPDLRPALKAAGLLKRDPRSTEHKKFGHKKNGRSYKFSKR